MSKTIAVTVNTDSLLFTSKARKFMFFNEPTILRVTFVDADGAAAIASLAGRAPGWTITDGGLE